MSKLKNERAEVKAEGASKKIQKRFAPAVRRWNQKMIAFHNSKESSMARPSPSSACKPKWGFGPFRFSLM